MLGPLPHEGPGPFVTLVTLPRTLPPGGANHPVMPLRLVSGGKVSAVRRDKPACCRG
jgi:hypothetical protein